MHWITDVYYLIMLKTNAYLIIIFHAERSNPHTRSKVIQNGYVCSYILESKQISIGMARQFPGKNVHSMTLVYAWLMYNPCACGHTTICIYCIVADVNWNSFSNIAVGLRLEFILAN